MAESYLEQLTKIKITGYKSIRCCEIDFGKINILIGSNGAGKSNFISAFTLLGHVLAGNLKQAVPRAGSASLFFGGADGSGEIDFEVFFGEISYGFTLVPDGPGGIAIKRESFCNRAVSDAAGDCRADIIKVIKKHNWRVYHFHDIASASLHDSDDIKDSASLAFDASNLPAFLYRLRRDFEYSYTEIVHTIRLIAPYFDDFALEPGPDGRVAFKWRQAGSGEILDSSQFSDGTLRFICLTTLLLQPRELQPATIIIDEPELGLHPYAITILAEMTGQLSSDRQIIISTQSVELLNEFSPEDVIVVDRDGAGSTFKRPDAAELDAWIETGYSLGELWKKNILGGRLSK